LTKSHLLLLILIHPSLRGTSSHITAKGKFFMHFILPRTFRKCLIPCQNTCTCRSTGLHQQKVSVRLKRKGVDLGSVMVRKAALTASHASFLPQSIFTKDLFARDYFWVRQVLGKLQKDAALLKGVKSFPLDEDAANSLPEVKLVNEVLMFHQ
jgi:hypothetical protein